MKNGHISDAIFRIVCYTVSTLFFLLCLLPFWLVIINSFATPQDIAKGFSIFPPHFSLETYSFVFATSTIFTNFRVSVTVTVLGTSLAVLVTTMYAYGLSHPKVKNRYILPFLTYIPMILGSGLIGSFLLIVKHLNLKNTANA